MLGESFIRWTARLAVGCYGARLICDTGRIQNESSRRIARWWWTIGCAWFLVHVASAFHFEHHWDHAAAYDYTSRRTAEITGWNSGAGLYINEAFLCLWLVDTVLWWRNRSWPENRRAYWIVQGIFGFLMIQATAVFGPPLWIPIVLAFIAVLVIRLLRLPKAANEPAPTAEFRPPC